jgi:predicted AlkP superfamily phosphohydrolase/phosphomutase
LSNLTHRILIVLLAVAAASFAKERVVVIGFDGVDHGYTKQFLAEGLLPNLQKLADSGDFKPLSPTIPAQTPVSWSTFTTGMHPGRHMVFDFLKRDPQTYMPSFAVAEEIAVPVLFGKRNRLILPVIAFGVAALLGLGLAALLRMKRRGRLLLSLGLGLVLGGGMFWLAGHWIPEARPWAKSNQLGVPFWEVLAERGVSCSVMRIPVTFPVHEFKGNLLAGLGVPDLSGRIGKPFFFTSDLFLPTEKNEFSVEIVELPDNQGEMTVDIVGPPNKMFGDPPYIKVPMTLSVADDRGSVTLKTCGQTVTLRPREWSDWVDFVFPFNPLVKVRGVSRFYCLSIDPEVRVYLSPINFDPRNLPFGFDVTNPGGWAKQLAASFGLFRTMGWSVDTWAVSEELTDDEFFMEEWQVEPAVFSRMFEGVLKEEKDLTVLYYEFTDRVGHIFFRFLDHEHPAYVEEAAVRFGGALKESYVLMDRLVGEAMRLLPPGTRLIVLSDHGFATWRWSVNYNTWLAQNGYIALTGASGATMDLTALFDQGQFWPNVDWSRTRAYVMGLGGLYINLKGREKQGIVEPGEEYENLRREIITRLEGWVDEAAGLHPVAKVYTREEAYGGFDPVYIPDGIITNNPGYRVSWQTSLGGMPRALIETNDQVWSGDHCSLHPPSVPGVIFANAPIKGENLYIGDLYPTLLALFGAEAPYPVDGKNLF